MFICSFFMELMGEMGVFFFFQAEDGIRDGTVTGVQTCALPILAWMLDQAPRWTTFEVNGRHVLARLDADDDMGGDMGKVLIGLSRFVEHVPPVVGSLYPPSGPPTTGF